MGSEREVALAKALADNNLEDRPDAIILKAYREADNANEDILETIVSHTKWVQKAYQNGLQDQCDQKLQKIADLCHDNYPSVDWKTIWMRVRSHIIPIIKVKCINNT